PLPPTLFPSTTLFRSNRAGSGDGQMTIGVRPEHVRFAASGLPAQVVRRADAGRFTIVEVECGGERLKLLSEEGEAIPEGPAHVRSEEHTSELQSRENI